MTAFAIVAALLIAAVCARLLPPLLKPAADAGADRRAANLAIFRDQLAELSRDRDAGLLTPADFASAEAELKKRLLDDVAEGEAAPAKPTPGAKRTAIALLVLVPLLGGLGYVLLGTPRALDPAAREQRPQVTAAQIEGMVKTLSEKLKANPDNPEGWVMLARSYKVLGRYDDAAGAFAEAVKRVGENADLLADWAEAKAYAQQGFAGEPAKLLERALKADPQSPKVLLLAGAAAASQGQFARAADLWSKALPAAEPGSEEEATIKSAIEKARAQAAAAAGKTPAKP